MKHVKVVSSNIHSIGHEGTTLEVRFNCGRCKGEGSEGHAVCVHCSGSGHTGSYRYEDVPAEIHVSVLAGESGEAGVKSSVGAAFNRLVRGKFKGAKA